MGAGMNKILPGLYVGSIRDSTDEKQIKENNITHILSIHDNAKNGAFENIKYLCFNVSDHAKEDIKQYFVEAIDFIHSARLNNGNVLVHCLAGVSRSTTLVISYIMTISEMPWYDSLNAVRAARKATNPNFGFQRQLQNFEFTTIKEVRDSLFSKYEKYDNLEDLNQCKTLLEIYKSEQNELISKKNPDNNVNSNPIKTYPLAFNAYNLDEEKEGKQISYDSKNKQVKEEFVLNEEEKEKEKEKVVNMLFE